MVRLSVDKLLLDLSGRYARIYAVNVSELIVAVATGNRQAAADASARLGKVIRETMGIVEVMVATEVLQGAARVIGHETGEASFDNGRRVLVMGQHYPERMVLRRFSATATQDVLPRVTFAEALEDMVNRTPTTIRSAARRTAANIAALYGEGSGGVTRVAFVRSAEQAVTERVQALLSEAIEKGTPELDFMVSGKLQRGGGSQIVDAVNAVRKHTEAWSASYARMAFRTNVNTAVTAGRFRQARDPDIREVIPALRFDAVGPPESAGGDTRNNHWAANGLIMSTDNPDWGKIAPPLGYS